MNDRTIYVRPEVLPKFVAFKILSADRIDNKSKPGQKSNVVYLEYTPGIKLQFYGDSVYQSFTEKEVSDFAKDIKNGKKFYVVSQGCVGDNFTVNFMSAELLAKHNWPMFDPEIHSLLVKPKSNNNGRWNSNGAIYAIH
ncbi:Oncoprotein-induced transcript 3 protein [Frankliniella fusca]|uniref:Oncoprotein-induced transcript 3 protein n=1 Tax=Frankliniella fusca TaxID=407009 RepID=A0AAE1HSY7_9NEOP|nr:Oncoprotein-induced transcript 3 protein [Frankliniella fusca]